MWYVNCECEEINDTSIKKVKASEMEVLSQKRSKRSRFDRKGNIGKRELGKSTEII